MKILLLALLLSSCSLLKKSGGDDEVSYTLANTEVEVGKRTAARLIAKYKLDTRMGSIKRISRLGNKAANIIGEKGRVYTFGLLKSKGAKHFSTPGGFIFLGQNHYYSIKNEDQLVALLGYEIAKVNSEYIQKKFQVNTKLDGSKWSNTADKISKFIMADRYPAGLHTRLDQEVLQLLMVMKRDPNTYLNYLKSRGFTKRYTDAAKHMNKFKSMASANIRR